MTSPEPKIAVGAIVLRDQHLLMVRRKHAPGEGLWSIPGGRVEGGEYLADALRREVREETGQEIEVGELAGIFEVVGDPHYVILDYLAEVSGDAPLVPGDDVGAARWVALRDVSSLECTPRFVEMLTAWGVLDP